MDGRPSVLDRRESNLPPYIYRRLIGPVLDGLDSELWHDRARHSLMYAERLPGGLELVKLISQGLRASADPSLRVRVAGLEFANPLLVGAGWDKAGQCIAGLHAMGFAGVEIGSVLARSQQGNPRPRQFIIAPGVALNRLGFNSPGLNAVERNLQRCRTPDGTGARVGISIGKNRDVPDADAPRAHAVVARRLYPYADYFVVNVSSPNTPGLRRLQDREPLGKIAAAVNAAMDEQGPRKPLLVKVAPELTPAALDEVIEVAREQSLAGIVAANSSASPALKGRYGEGWAAEPGGLSGDDAEYRRICTEMVRHIYRRTGGSLVVIGVGGISTPGAALERIRAGASLIQTVTGIRSAGPGVASYVLRGVAVHLRAAGLKSVSELVGADA